MSDWKSEIEKEWNRRASASPSSEFLFPLILQSFDQSEIIAMVDILLTGRLTMSQRVKDFERKFAEAVGAKYAVMVNSGSSANLLAMAVAANPMRKHHLRPGDEVLVPAVCWSTSLWPVIQLGLKPVIVDTDPTTLNLDLKDMKEKITSRTKAVFAVHVLGNSAPMAELLAICEKHGLILIEDTCESLGSRTENGVLGTLGAFGTYSFYYSHHLTTGEGGMVVCRTEEDYDLLKCLRAHGWTRELSNRVELEKRHSDIDPRFLFVNIGYNFRPMEIQAAMGLCQLEKLPQMNRSRVQNWKRLKEALLKHPSWNGQLIFPEPAPGTEPVWFGFPCLLKSGLERHHQAYLNYLSRERVENRPIISGNFARQPALKLFNIECEHDRFPGAETINARGFFIGLHTEELSSAMIEKLAGILMGYRFS